MIRDNLEEINHKITKTCKLYSVDKGEVKLVAVSKTIHEGKILEAIDLGHYSFGENYLQDALDKWPKIKTIHPDVELHFIGKIQGNKIKDIVSLFDFIHTLDNEKHAKILKEEMQSQKKNLKILIQVNIGEEPQKSGVLPCDLKDFISFCKSECGLDIHGLMCIPPAGEFASPYFGFLNKLAKENSVEKLSMGMSSDFEEAVAIGANYIRVGEAIFGERI